jgi:hypothetical protein
MRGLHPSIAARVDRWLDRCGRAFVMEVECRDGTRYLVGLEPSWHGCPTLAVADDGTGDDGWVKGLRAPDDLRDLVP